jgi:glucosamine kinase
VTREPLVAGVDAGGSSTRVVVLDADGAERARLTGAGSAVRAGGEASSAETVMRLVGDAVRRAGAAGIEALVVGAAGAGHAAPREAFIGHLRSGGAPPLTRVVTDAEAAYASVFGEDAGILVLSGTGSIALARDPDGTWNRAGGWGWRVGDEGSGYAIGRAGVAAVGRALDGRGPATSLGTTLPRTAGAADAASLMLWAREAAPAEVAALGAEVQEAAARGDPVAEGIVAEAAQALLAHARALATRFPAAGLTPVVLGGGALGPGGALRRAVEALAARTGGITVVDREIDAGHGAAQLALRLLRGGPTTRGSGGPTA